MDDAKLTAIARTVHEAMRGWVMAHGEKPTPAWLRAEKWMRDSTKESVLFAINNPDAPHSAQHDQWMEQKKRDGWVYGDVKSAEEKTHPMLVPYTDLPEFEKKKDAIVKAIALSLSEEF